MAPTPFAYSPISFNGKLSKYPDMNAAAKPSTLQMLQHPFYLFPFAFLYASTNLLASFSTAA